MASVGTPAGRDELLEARTKDTEGVAGHLKKFGEGMETTYLKCSMGDWGRRGS